MDNLIEALQIFRKYGNPMFPTHCEHDTLYVYPDVKHTDVSLKDLNRLAELGFEVDEDTDDGWISFYFGSC